MPQQRKAESRGNSPSLVGIAQECAPSTATNVNKLPQACREAISRPKEANHYPSFPYDIKELKTPENPSQACHIKHICQDSEPVVVTENAVTP